jgi:hypothetical protein
MSASDQITEIHTWQRNGYAPSTCSIRITSLHFVPRSIDCIFTTSTLDTLSWLRPSHNYLSRQKNTARQQLTMLPSATDLILPTIRTWARENAKKISAIFEGGSWEGWAQAEIAYEMSLVMLKEAAADHPDTCITVRREVPLWTNVGQGEDRMRADLLVRFDTNPGCFRTGTFFCKFPCPVEASTRIRLLICITTPI